MRIYDFSTILKSKPIPVCSIIVIGQILDC